jgi:hypothetical protein
MKKMLWILAWLLVCVGSAGAVTGIEIGIRTGVLSNFDQPSLNIGTYDLNRLNMFGGQIYISRLPMVDIIVAGEYCWRTRTYEIAGESMEFKLRDFAVTASVVYPFKQLPLVTPYIGAGIGTYSLSYEYLVPLSLSLDDNGVSIPETSTHMGYHGVLGAKLNVPAFPVGVFLEGRLNRISTSGDDVKYTTLAGGVFLALP